MPTIGEIVVALTADTGKFNAGMKSAQDKIGSVSKGLTAAGAALSAIGVPFAMAAKSALDNADAMGKMAQKAGTSVEFLSSLSHAAQLSDISTEELQKSLVKLSSKLQDAGEGKAAAERLFKGLGIAATDSEGRLRSVEQVFPAIAQALAGMEDGAEKTALAVDLFGKSGADLIPLLNAGAGGIAAMRAESDRFGQTISTSTAKAAEELNDNITRLGNSISGFFNAIISSPIVGALADIVGRVADMAANFARAHPEIAAAVGVVGGLAAVLGPLILAAGALSAAIAALSTPILAVFGAAGAIGVAIAGIVAFAEKNEAFRNLLIQTWDEIKVHVTDVIASLSETFAAASELWSTFWAEWGDEIQTVVIPILKLIGTDVAHQLKVMFATLKLGLDTATGAIKAFTGLIQGDWNKFAEGIKKIWQGLWDAIVKIMGKPMEDMRKRVEGFTTAVGVAFDVLYERVVGHSSVPDLIEGIKDEFGRLSNVMVHPVETATALVSNAFEGMFSEVIGKFTRNIPIIGGAINRIATRLGDKAIGGLFGTGAAGAGAAGAGAKAGGIGISGAKLGAFFSNPLTIGIGAAVGGIIAATKLIGGGRRAADDFGRSIETPFNADLTTLLAQFHSQRDAGTLTLATATAFRDDASDLIGRLSAAQAEFAAQGENQAKVVQQAIAGKDANFGVGFSRIFDEINAAIKVLPKSGTGIAETGRSFSASNVFSDAVDRLVPAFDRFVDVSRGTTAGAGNTVTVNAPLTVNVAPGVQPNEIFNQWLEHLRTDRGGALTALNRMLESAGESIATA